MPDSREPIRPPVVRRYRPEDRPAVIGVIRSVYEDYSYVMDFEEFDRDLADIQSFYQDAGGEFWVLDEGGAIAGVIGVVPFDGETCELRRLYVYKGRRGRGFGSALIRTVITWSGDKGYRRVVLWSDVLFDAAHHLYMKHGFTATERTRAIDPMNPTSVERFFEREG
jgi:putative acetyltransferase